MQNYNVKFKILGSIFLFFIFYFLFSGSAHAQYGFTDYLGAAPGGEYTLTWFFTMLSRLTCYLIQFAIISFGVMLIVYGLMYFKGMGNPQSTTNARRALTWGLLGGLVIFSVFTIVLSVASLLGADFRILDMVKC